MLSINVQYDFAIFASIAVIFAVAAYDEEAGEVSSDDNGRVGVEILLKREEGSGINLTHLIGAVSL